MLRWRMMIGLALTLLTAVGAAAQDPGSSDQVEADAALTGRVLDDAGQPVKGARVELFGTVRPDALSMLGRKTGAPDAIEATTDGAGQFQFSGMNPGHYALAVQASGLSPRILPAVHIEARSEVQDLGDLVLEEEAVLSLLVVDEAGDPVPDAYLHIWGQHARQSERDGYSRALRSVLSQQGKTDAEGRLRFGGLQADQELLLSIRHPQFVSPQHQVTPSSEVLQLTLDRGATLRGQVVDSEGRPVADADLRILVKHEVEGRFSGSSSWDAGRSHEDGTFEIFGVDPGKITLKAELEGYVPGTTTFVVAADDVIEGLSMELATGLELQGRVVDEHGKGLSGINIGVSFDRPSETHRYRRATSEEDGRFQLTALPTGPATVRARSADQRHSSQAIVLGPKMESLTLVLESGPALSGRVVDENGQGIQLAEMHLRGPISLKTLRSGDDGRFSVALEGAGDYTMRVTRKDLGWSESPIEVAEGESIDGVELTLPAGGRIVGQIRGLGADDLAKLDLDARHSDPTSPFRATRQGRVDPNGNFEIGGIMPGVWSVTARLGGSARRDEQTVEVEGLNDTAVNLDLGVRGVTLSGQVLHNGEPSSLARIYPGGVQADSNGRFRIEGLEPGPYELKIFGPWGEHVHEGAIDADAEIQISIESFQLAGQVVDEDGRPVDGVEVLCLHNGTRRSTRTDSETEGGRFEIRDLKSGNYQLVFQKPGFGTESTTVSVGGHRDDLRIVLRPTESVMLEARWPDVRAVDRIAVLVLDGSEQFAGMQRLTPEVDGRFRLDFLPIGTRDLVVLGDDSAPSRLEVQVPGGPYSVQLQPATLLVVRVPDLADGEMMAWLDIVDADGRPFTPNLVGVSDPRWHLSRGHFSFPLLPPGTWQLTVTAKDGRQWQGSVETSPQATAELVLP